MKKKTKSKRAEVAKDAPKPAKKFPEVKNLALRKTLEKAGGYPQLAAALGISRQSVHKWEAVPDRFAVTVEQLYGIPRYEIAPHLYEGMAVSE
jgi:DNA-binding transcriptional regulator YiaG